MKNICVSGSKGKMGSTIIALAKADPELHVSGEFDVLEENPDQLVDTCDCLIEFTSPTATMEHVELCKTYKKAIVIGTTGISEADIKKIKEMSKSIPVVLSPNMSVGVNLLFKMVRDAAKTLGPEYTINIVEAHHAEKKDAPSGTAKEIAKIIKEEKAGVEAPIESIREGEVIGEHTVTFESDVDTIEITHSAKTREIFARGAIKAAKFAVEQKPGLYTMKDVLGL